MGPTNLNLLHSILQRASLTDFIPGSQNPPYPNGGTIHEQIQCYALPFGAIGMVSHLLTYYTVICLARGRSPLLPWTRLSRRYIGITSTTVGLLVSFPLTVRTMVQCRNTWEFILIAVWKVTLSLTLSFMSIHAAWIARERPSRSEQRPRRSRDESAIPLNEEYSQYRSNYSLREPEKKKPDFGVILVWLVLYGPGSIIGFVGVMNLVAHHFNDADMAALRTVTYAFSGVAGGLTLLVVLLVFLGQFLQERPRMRYVALEVSVSSVIDWVLATLNGDLPYDMNENVVWTASDG
ncbi:hypothetical protein GQ53DRAFT_802900 [Thozetella sp. PMI_491]|nr:hypothetical protein GQ53DRAFT_802900 [Thozetella sp. PMI_491]